MTRAVPHVPGSPVYSLRDYHPATPEPPAPTLLDTGPWCGCGRHRTDKWNALCPVCVDEREEAAC